MGMGKGREILVVGAGTMGAPIAQVYASAGYQVTLTDINPEVLRRAEARIASNLKTLAEFGEIDEQVVKETPGRITYAADYRETAPRADLVVETVTENPDLKREIFAELGRLCSPQAILTSNTSAMNIFDAAPVSHPERQIIFHWCTPAHIMPLVELVMGPATSVETLQKCQAIAAELGKQAVVVRQYIPGFIINRLSAAMAREAGYMVGKGWASPGDIDTAICNTFGLRYGFEGHLELFDYIGWDVAYLVGAFLNPLLCSDPTPADLARQMVEKNTLGVKTGQGLKDYHHLTPEQAEEIRQRKILKMKKALQDIRA